MKAKIQPTSASRDLIVIACVFILVLIFSYFFDVFVFIVRFVERRPGAIVYIDEIITGLLALSISFAVFARRRLAELKKETAERVRLQEELIRAADTKAEIERIIARQLHSEIEQRKELERGK